MVKELRSWGVRELGSAPTFAQGYGGQAPAFAQGYGGQAPAFAQGCGEAGTRLRARLRRAGRQKEKG